MSRPQHSPGMLVIVPISKGRSKSNRNFIKTVESQWTLDNIIDLGDDVAKIVESIAGKLKSTKYFAIWGVNPKAPGAKRLISGISSLGNEEDEGTQRIVAFYRDGKITCWGEIFAGVRSRKLAKKLWNSDKWEYVYFIKNLKCCEPGIPWDDVRKKLNYRSGFTPRGHTFVEPSRLTVIRQKYGGISQFLESLASEIGCREPGTANAVGETGTSKGFPPRALTPEETLEAIGRKLVGLSKRILKFEAAELMGEALESGPDGQVSPRGLLEDLKRLGLVVVEHSQSAGREGASGAGTLVTRAAVRAADAVKACIQCKSKVSEVSDRFCYQVGGSVAVIELWVSGAGSAPESVMRLAMDIAKRALKDECIPLLYVPLNIESLSGS